MPWTLSWRVTLGDIMNMLIYLDKFLLVFNQMIFYLTKLFLGYLLLVVVAQ